MWIQHMPTSKHPHSHNTNLLTDAIASGDTRMWPARFPGRSTSCSISPALSACRDPGPGGLSKQSRQESPTFINWIFPQQRNDPLVLMIFIGCSLHLWIQRRKECEVNRKKKRVWGRQPLVFSALSLLLSDFALRKLYMSMAAKENRKLSYPCWKGWTISCKISPFQFDQQLQKSFSRRKNFCRD